MRRTTRKRVSGYASAALAAALAVFGLGSARARADDAANGPPPGTRSLFDYVFTKGTGASAQYDVPNSVEGIIDRLRKLNVGEPLTVLIPFGRSVQRFETDPTEPRIVITMSAPTDRQTFDKPLVPRLTGRIFMGYGFRVDQLEVISYNERAGRYEFQLVKNVRDPEKQKVVYAPRNFCKACHIQESPFFPRNPWQETSSFEATAAAIIAAHGNTPYHGVPVSSGNNTAYEFDRTVDSAGLLLANQSLWQKGCDGPSGAQPDGAIECRLLALKLAFRKRFSFVIPSSSDEYKRLTSLFQERALPAIGPELRFPITDLRARNPLNASGGFAANAQVQFTTTDTTDAVLDELRHNSSIPAEFDPLSADAAHDDPYMFNPAHQPQSSVYHYPDYLAVDDIPKIKQMADPATLNGFIDWIATELLVDKAFYKGFFVSAGADAAAKYASIDKALSVLAAQGAAGPLGGMPFAADDFLVAFAKAAGAQQALKTCCNKDAPVAVLEGQGTDTGGGNLTAEEAAGVQFMTSNCGDCHGDASSAPFAVGGFQTLDAKPALAVKIMQRLNWEACKPAPGRREMPPAGQGEYRSHVCQDAEGRAAFLALLQKRYQLSDSALCGGQVRNPPISASVICSAGK